MGSLKNSHIDPSLSENPLDQMEVYKNQSGEQIEVLEQQIADWKEFQQTKSGVVVSDLADPHIAHLMSKICGGIEDLRRHFDSAGMIATSEDIKDYVSECRGALSVWRAIKYKMPMLEAQLKEINDHQARMNEKKEEVPDSINQY